MPARFERIDAHIAYFILEGKVTYEEIDEAGKQRRAYFREIGKMPDVLLINAENARVMFDIANLRQILRADEIEKASVGMVLVGTRPTIQLGGKVLANVLRQNAVFAKTLEEGLEKARAMRDTHITMQRKPAHDA